MSKSVINPTTNKVNFDLVDSTLLKLVQDVGLEGVVKHLEKKRPSQKSYVAGKILQRLGETLQNQSKQHCMDCKGDVSEGFGMKVKYSWVEKFGFKEQPTWVQKQQELKDEELRLKNLGHYKDISYPRFVFTK